MKRALLVDDSIIIQRITAKVLESKCIVDATASVSQALSLLQKHDYDVVITDFMLKEGACLDLVRAIRLKADAKALPIVIITTSLDNLLLNKFLRLGVNEAVMKPVPPDKIKQLVERMLVDPYVRELPPSGQVEVECYHWECGAHFYAFNPETQTVVEGASKEEVTAKMRKVLESSKVGWIGDGARVKYVVNWG